MRKLLTLLEQRGPQLAPSEREILETYAAYLEADIGGDPAESLALIEQVYLMSLEEFNRSGDSILWQELQVDFPLLLSALRMGYEQAEEVSFSERVEALDRISRYAPEDLDLQDTLIDVMEEEMPYPEIIAYCDGRIRQGHDYFRCLKVYMRVDYQQDLIHQALKQRYGNQHEPWEIWQDYYDPSVVSHDQVALAFKEAWADPTTNPKYLREYCSALLQAFWVTRSREQEVRRFIEQSLARIATLPEEECSYEDVAAMEAALATILGPKPLVRGPGNAGHNWGQRVLKRMEREASALDDVTPAGAPSEAPPARESTPDRTATKQAAPSVESPAPGVDDAERPKATPAPVPQEEAIDESSEGGLTRFIACGIASLTLIVAVCLVYLSRRKRKQLRNK